MRRISFVGLCTLESHWKSNHPWGDNLVKFIREKAPQTKIVVHNVKFVEKNGKWVPKGEFCHMGRDGNYLQALVWTAKLFGADVTKCSYAPKGMSVERAEFLRRIAMKAMQK